MITIPLKRSLLLLGLIVLLTIFAVTEVTAQTGPGFVFSYGQVTCDTPTTWRVSSITVYPSNPPAPYWRRWSQSYPITAVAPFIVDPIRVNNEQSSFTYTLPVNWYSSQNGGWVAGTQGSVTIPRPACADPQPALEVTPPPVVVQPTPIITCGPRACRPSIEPPIRGGLVKEVTSKKRK